MKKRFFAGILVLLSVFLLCFVLKSMRSSEVSEDQEKSSSNEVNLVFGEMGRAISRQKATSINHSRKRREISPKFLEEVEKMKSRMKRNISNPKIIKRRDGGEGLLLNGAYQSVSAAKVMPDGKVVVECFEHYGSLREFLVKGASASTGDK
ncbi:MAG: hypothetical protein AAGA18_04755 [Verrucomicrobiota bacterium]